MRSNGRKIRRKSRRSRNIHILILVMSMLVPVLSWVFLNTSICEVRRISVHGVRYGYPEDMILESGIGAGINIFSNLKRYENLLSAHPLIRKVHIERRPPRALFVRIEEREPFVYLNQVRPVLVSPNGVVLPADRIAVELDLPLLTIRGREEESGKSEYEGLQFLSNLRNDSPVLFTRTSELVVQDGIPLILYLRSPQARILLGERFTPLTSRLLTGVLRKLGREESFYEIDLRFRNQAVVRQMGESGKPSLYDSI